VQYTHLTGLLKNRALAELRKFVTDGLLEIKGTGNRLVFIRKSS
jgi:hypothetical protein